MICCESYILNMNNAAIKKCLFFFLLVGCIPAFPGNYSAFACNSPGKNIPLCSGLSTNNEHHETGCIESVSSFSASVQSLAKRSLAFPFSLSHSFESLKFNCAKLTSAKKSLQRTSQNIHFKSTVVLLI